MLQAKLSKDEINTVEREACTELWHRRLGHISEKGMRTLARSGLLPEETGTSLKPCVHCLAGKQCRFSFIKTASRRTHALDLVHSDVCGLMKVSSLYGAQYFIAFIDDYSRKVDLCIGNYRPCVSSI